MIYRNLTKRKICMTDGRSFLPEETSARLWMDYPTTDERESIEASIRVKGLPEYREGIRLIVSLPVFLLVGRQRPDVVTPAWTHPESIRDASGSVTHVGGFQVLSKK